MNQYDATEIAFKNGYKSGIMNLADRLKKYYSNLNGSTSTALTAYHIDQIANELVAVISGNAEKCVSCGEIIPEGRQICPNCEKETNRKRGEEE